MDISQQSERFYTAFRQMQQILRQQLQPHLNRSGLQLTRSQFYLLRHLYTRGAVMVTELADWMNVRPATMSPIIDRIEKHGLVSRNKDVKDRRIVFVELTEQGRTMVQQMETTWRQVLTEHLSGLTDQEREMLINLVEKFNRSE